MGWYEIAKVVHFLAVIALFGFFIVWARAGARLRAATTVEEVRTWLGLLDATRGMVPGAGVLFLVTGIAMAAMRWRGRYPFVTVGLIALILIWLLWALVGARHLRAMRSAAEGGEGRIAPDLARLILDPLPWATVGALIGAALGVLFVMTTKLGWGAAVSAVLLTAAIVGVSYALMVRRQRDRTERSSSRGTP
jgi:hypothetical protein